MPLNLMERVMFLRSTELGSSLPDPAIRVMSEVAREMSVPAQQAIFLEGDLGTEMYLVVEGSVEVRRLGHAPPPGASGEALGSLLTTLGPGDVVGEMSVLDDRPRSASIVAASAVSFLTLHREDLRDAIALCPDLAFGLFRVLAERLRNTLAAHTATATPLPRRSTRKIAP
jgi:CRP/FNR family cyclic AMP-dependent transcriptional regulator